MTSRENVASRNPFAANDFIRRDNFPGLDGALDFFGGTDNDERKMSPSNQQGSFYDDRISPDQSVCSHQTSSSLHNTSSCLNMSIGARAALTEHLRYVAMHGIDGLETPGETSVASFERLPQDEVWDRLMDGNLSITSNSAPSLFDRLQPIVSISEHGEEAVEVLFDANDSGSDFFDSSRIWQLATPEKNKAVKRSITTKRGDEQYDESDSGSQASGMMYLYNAALAMHETSAQSNVDQSTSFLSLGVDLSRISNSDLSDMRSSPGEMFGDDFSEVATPSRRRSPSHRDASFSTPIRRGILSPERSLFSPARRSGSAIRGGGGEKENTANLAMDIGLSPIAAQAGSIAVKLGRPSRRHHPGEAFPSFSPSPRSSPQALVDRMQSVRLMDEPSPISQANSGFDMRNYPVTVTENCILDMDDKRESSKSSSSIHIGLKPRGKHAPSPSLSSISAQGSLTKQQHYSSSGSSEEERRRQYRTVVPARVFMDDPEDFPNHDDSFSSRSATATSTASDDSEPSPLRSRSLLVSFNEADEFEVPLNDE